jgi:hypothetical protein
MIVAVTANDCRPVVGAGSSIIVPLVVGGYAGRTPSDHDISIVSTSWALAAPSSRRGASPPIRPRIRNRRSP